MTTNVLLFDLDGTLTDPKPGIVGSLRFALDQLAVPSPADDVLATYIGPPLRGTFATLLGTDDRERIEEAMRLYRSRFAETGLYENRVYDGVPAMLERAGRVATAIYVATSKPAIYAERIVRHFGLAQHFRRVYGAELDGLYEKKAELLAHLLETEHLAADAVIMVGDREADVRAAKAIGARSIGVLWGYGSAEELVNAGVDALCQRPSELATQLGAREFD